MSQGSKECAGCGRPLASDQRGRCPACGSERARLVVAVGTASESDSAGRLGWVKASIREYNELHPMGVVALVALGLAPPFIGLLLADAIGFMVGLLAGVLSLAIGPRAIRSVRHERIEKGG